MRTKTFGTRLTSLLASKRFFYCLLGFFLFESAWIALSAIYPMPFDEDFHLGIIKIYSTHWLPFLSEQPAGADAFGAVARDPSYLYHYLMSFPCRALTHVTNNPTTQIVALRFINIALFACSLILFRRLMIRALRSPALAHLAIAVFILIPVVPQLAAHINYDNLVMVMVAVTGLLVFRIIEQLKVRAVDPVSIVWLINVCILGCLVKYAFLPIFAATGLFVLIYGVIALRGGPWPTIWREFRARLTPGVIIGLLTLTVVSSGLFVQRYGENVFRYHTLTAECEKILDYDHCSAYGPWIRNHEYAQTKGEVDKNPLGYFRQWMWGMRYRLFFAISGPPQYTNYPPLTLPYQTSIVLGVVSLVVLIVYAPRIFYRQPFMVFAFLTTALYVGVLFLDEYEQFLETGQPVAINGRYLVPLMLLLTVVIGRGFQVALDRRRTWLRPVLGGAVLLLFLQGGGVMTFILRSDAGWDWHNDRVIRANDEARKLLQPVVIEGSKYY